MWLQDFGRVPVPGSVCDYLHRHRTHHKAQVYTSAANKPVKWSKNMALISSWPLCYSSSVLAVQPTTARESPHPSVMTSLRFSPLLLVCCSVCPQQRWALCSCSTLGRSPSWSDEYSANQQPLLPVDEYASPFPLFISEEENQMRQLLFSEQYQ